MKVFAVPVIGNSQGVSYLEIILFVRYDFITISLRFRYDFVTISWFRSFL